LLNGDSPVPTRSVGGVVQPVAPITAEQKLAKKNELKARGEAHHIWLSLILDKKMTKYELSNG
nr:hypothetical protein [Tanacetum cinerariifolium]